MPGALRVMLFLRHANAAIFSSAREALIERREYAKTRAKSYNL